MNTYTWKTWVSEMRRISSDGSHYQDRERARRCLDIIGRCKRNKLRAPDVVGPGQLIWDNENKTKMIALIRVPDMDKYPEFLENVEFYIGSGKKQTASLQKAVKIITYELYNK